MKFIHTPEVEYARSRMKEEEVSEAEYEVIGTIKTGEKLPAKFGRIGFRRN